MEVVYTETFGNWLRRLRDPRAKAVIVSRIERIEDGNFGDRKSVGGGVSELRIDVGKGYRVYYTIRRRTVVVLLCGGDKSNQQRDVRRAHRIAGQL
ncbi:MAG: type II toxin-antitoxin system RelE/ParE family toxin [Rhodospirillaceae bacterium]|nr:type II toxin-antitoxin system RelE/ParE family toxin [Rhodospirillaceae bacterium]